MAGYAPIMWTVWSALVVVVLALKLYTGRLSRDEDDHLILDSAFDQMKTEQAAMVAKVNKVEPLMKVFLWLAVGMTAVVIAYYLTDFFSQFK
jgi:uncharacterized membrane protein